MKRTSNFERVLQSFKKPKEQLGTPTQMCVCLFLTFYDFLKKWMRPPHKVVGLGPVTVNVLTKFGYFVIFRLG